MLPLADGTDDVAVYTINLSPHRGECLAFFRRSGLHAEIVANT
jgi:hypothetical protein